MVGKGLTGVIDMNCFQNVTPLQNAKILVNSHLFFHF